MLYLSFERYDEEPTATLKYVLPWRLPKQLSNPGCILDDTANPTCANVHNEQLHTTSASCTCATNHVPSSSATQKCVHLVRQRTPYRNDDDHDCMLVPIHAHVHERRRHNWLQVRTNRDFWTGPIEEHKHDHGHPPVETLANRIRHHGNEPTRAPPRFPSMPRRIQSCPWRPFVLNWNAECSCGPRDRVLHKQQTRRRSPTSSFASCPCHTTDRRDESEDKCPPRIDNVPLLRRKSNVAIHRLAT